jgi:ligand-binding SRPBCC domain-containing protein
MMNGSMLRFSHRTRIQAGLREVSDFHSDTRALKRLTPPPVIVQIHSAQPLGEGSVSEFTMWMGPVPVRWTARHRDVEQPGGFTDEQLSGPFKTWVHRHRFEQVEADVCEITDEIQAAPGSGLYAGTISRLMWMGLPFMFAYRARILKKHLTGRSNLVEAQR